MCHHKRMGDGNQSHSAGHCPFWLAQFPSQTTRTQSCKAPPSPRAPLLVCSYLAPPTAPAETEMRTLLSQLQLVQSNNSKYLGSKCLVIQRSHTLISCMPKKNDTTKQLPSLPARPATPPNHWLPCIHPSMLYSWGPLTSQSVGHANTYQ